MNAIRFCAKPVSVWIAIYVHPAKIEAEALFDEIKCLPAFMIEHQQSTTFNNMENWEYGPNEQQPCDNQGKTSYHRNFVIAEYRIGLIFIGITQELTRLPIHFSSYHNSVAPINGPWCATGNFN
jgi:hypothetical protein